MTQPQNPNLNPLLARVEGNSGGADLIQIVEMGGSVIYRLNNFQAVWYAGTGAPTTIPGVFPGNLYIDISTGNIWELNLLLIWVLLPSGGGGGGGVTSLNGLSGVLSILAGAGISVTTAGSGITVANTGVVSLNGVSGAASLTSTDASVSIIASGNTINLEVAGSGSGGVTSLNTLTGDLAVTAGPGIDVSVSNPDIEIENTGVLSLNAITGAADIVPVGSGISVLTSGQDVEIQNTGVTSLAVSTGLSASGSTGAITLGNTGVTSIAAGTGIIASAPTGAITISANASTPWVDIQNYGGIPKTYATYAASTTATINSGSPNLTVGSALPFFVDGAGICIWGAGPATLQTTPAAPTVTSPVVQGSQIITYKCVGFDAGGGLTAASSAGTVSNAPAIFGPPPVSITSISLTSNVVTVHTSAALNNTLVAGMTVHIVGVTGAGSGWNGVFTIASASSTSQFTYALTAANGTGTVTNATARVSNAQLITAITRAATGVVSITTAENHNWQVGGIVIVENVTPPDLNGWYPILSVSGNTLTAQSPIYASETGVVSTVAPQSTATVWEYITVACPTLTNFTGPTVGYYIYSDSYSPGSSLKIIGKTYYWESVFTDWGQAYSGGYTQPGNVSLTPPVAAQAQTFSSIIISGGGTTSLVLANNASTSVSGATIQYDDGPALLAALAAGPTLLSPSVHETVATPYTYVFNSPVVLPQGSNVLFGTTAVINDTWDCTDGGITLTAQTATPAPQVVSFGLRSYARVIGSGNPMILGGQGFNTDGICFFPVTNGQNNILVIGTYTGITNCAFEMGGFGNSIGLIYQGSTSAAHLRDNTFNGTSAFGDGPVTGQSSFSPFVPALLFRAGSNTVFQGYPPNQILIDGTNTFNSRGIMFDGTFYTNATAFQYQIGDTLWMQGSAMPAVIFTSGNTGDAYSNIVISGVLVDSEPAPILGCFATIRNVKIVNCAQGDQACLITGQPVIGLNTSAYYGFCPPGPNSLSEIFGLVIENQSTGRINGSSEVQSCPRMLGQTGTIFGQFLAPTPTLATSVSGTFAAGVHNVALSCVGWDGGETALGTSVSITVSGSQGIKVTWTMPSGFQGVHIWIDGNQQVGLFTSSPQTFTTPVINNISPTIDGTGLPFIGNSEVVAQTLLLPSGVNKLTVTPPNMTANRTMSFGDGANSAVVATSLTTTSSGSPYTLTLQGATSSSHISITPTNAAAALDMATGNVYISSKGTNQVVIVTGMTSGETFDILATVN